jgi:hypothetical protein
MRNNLIARGVGYVPGLKRLPIFKLLALGEIAILAREHLVQLKPAERRRLVHLVQTSRGRKGNLSDAERRELAGLLGKLEPRVFAGTAADKLSPVPLPKRVTLGPRRERRAREQARAKASSTS